MHRGGRAFEWRGREFRPMLRWTSPGRSAPLPPDHRFARGRYSRLTRPEQAAPPSKGRDAPPAERGFDKPHECH